MITTREVNVDLAKEKLKLRGVTTKNIDPSVRVEPPKAKIKPRGVTTTTQADVADIAEKKRRDDIAIEKKLAMKDEKKIMLADNEGDVEITKIPWKEMTEAEKKVEMKKRAAKGKATRARKKKEKEKELERKNKKD